MDPRRQSPRAPEDRGRGQRIAGSGDHHRMNADVQSIDAIVNALYESISGAAGVPPQWEREAAIYRPEARFFPARRDNPLRVQSLDQYKARVDEWLVTNGFFEYETERE